jgi:hypothetical protein
VGPRVTLSFEGVCFNLWAAPPLVLRAVDVLERLSEPLRRRTGRPQLWLTIRGSGIVDTRSAEVITVEAIIPRLNGIDPVTGDDGAGGEDHSIEPEGSEEGEAGAGFDSDDLEEREAA